MPASKDRIAEGYECWFEYAGSTKETLATGLRCITDPDDPRWEEELAGPQFRGRAHGYLSISWVQRVDGEVSKKTLKYGESCHANRAREKMREFERLVMEGSETPWDQDRTFRDAEDKAKKAEREGRERDLAVITGALKTALAGAVPGGDA